MDVLTGLIDSRAVSPDMLLYFLPACAFTYVLYQRYPASGLVALPLLTQAMLWFLQDPILLIFNSPVSISTKLEVAQAIARGGDCCQSLARLSGLEVNFPASQTYSTVQSSWWAAQQGAIKPACIVQPTSSAQVSKAILTLSAGSKFFRKQSQTCTFAIRGGGHSPVPGSPNRAGGVTLDLSRLSHVQISADRTVVDVGGGNKWFDVYSVLSQHGLATTGGRNSDVGVGGLTTGAGISFFSPRYGFSCNSVLEFEVVLGSGEIVRASEKEHEDLWRALKGGSGNFGIVTNFKMVAFEQGDFWGGSVASSIDTRKAQFQAFEDFVAVEPFDPYAALIHSYAWSSAYQIWFINSIVQYTKSDPPVEKPDVFKGFMEHAPMQDTTRISNITDKTDEVKAFDPLGFHQLFVTATYSPRAKMMEHVFERANETLQTIIDVPGLMWALSFQPLPSVVTEKAATTGGDALGLDPVLDGSLMNVLLSAKWANATDTERVHAAARRLFEKSDAEAKHRGWFHPYIYLNYAAAWQKPFAGYGEKSLARLKAVSDKYDAGKVFQNLAPGGFKLYD